MRCSVGVGPARDARVGAGRHGRGRCAAAGNSVAQGAIAVLRRGATPFDAGELGALATLASMSAVALHNADLRDAQRNFFSHVTDMLVTALDNHLGFHRGHGQRVAQLANRVGRRLGMGDQELARLHFAALLHDIGMLKLDAISR